MHEKRCEFSWWGDNKEMTIVNLGSLYYAFGASGITYEVAQHLECHNLDIKRKSNLKLLKDKIL